MPLLFKIMIMLSKFFSVDSAAGKKLWHADSQTRRFSQYFLSRRKNLCAKLHQFANDLCKIRNFNTNGTFPNKPFLFFSFYLRFAIICAHKITIRHLQIAVICIIIYSNRLYRLSHISKNKHFCTLFAHLCHIHSLTPLRCAPKVTLSIITKACQGRICSQQPLNVKQTSYFKLIKTQKLPQIKSARVGIKYF